MDEGLIRALVIGGTLGAIGLVATLAWKLMRSPREAAQRTRIVLGVLVGGFVLYAALAGPRGDRPFFIGLGIALAAFAFIAGATKK